MNCKDNQNSTLVAQILKDFMAYQALPRWLRYSIIKGKENMK